MKTTFKIKAIAPTSYQLRSLLAFGMQYKALGNGSYVAISEIFDTEEEAKAYLEKRADMYYENENELNEALSDIECGVLTLDAVTARIEEIEESEELEEC